MGKQLRLIIFSVSALVLIAFCLFVANQTVQFVGLVSSFNPVAGQVALVLLLIIYASLIAVPVFLFARLPRSLQPPADTDSPDFAAYRKKLKSRLASNPRLAGHDFSSDAGGLESALKVLDSKSNAIIKATASAIFVSTAVSQSGRLDGMMVLVAQSRMVWQLAHVYHQRPAFQDLVRLYANVAFATFASVQIEDLDLGEQVSNVIGPAIAASSVGAVPGVSAVASVLTDAMIDGSANAFLTLRVGVIARRLCSSPQTANRSVLRKLAGAEAATMFGGILADSSAVVTRAIMGAASKAGRAAFARSFQATKGALNAAIAGLSYSPEKPAQGQRPPALKPDGGPQEQPGQPGRRPRPRWGNTRNG